MERPRHPPRDTTRDSVGAYAIQCNKCFKWRLIPTKEEYETIRHNFLEDPWYCEKKSYTSCDDPPDLEYDTSRLWVIDKPNIPKPPPNTERMLMMRRDLSKMDALYILPTGKRVRSCNEVEKFLEANPQYKDKFQASDFVFSVPKVMDDMVPRNQGSASAKKRMKRAKEAED